MQILLNILPLALNLVVALHLNLRLSPFKAVSLTAGDNIIEDKGIGTLLPILRQYTDE